MEKYVLTPKAQAALDDLNAILAKLFDIEQEFEYFPCRHREVFDTGFVIEREEFADLIEDCQLMCGQAYNQIIRHHADLKRWQDKE